jgi:hypothetical protein
LGKKLLAWKPSSPGRWWADLESPIKAEKMMLTQADLILKREISNLY